MNNKWAATFIALAFSLSMGLSGCDQEAGGGEKSSGQRGGKRESGDQKGGAAAPMPRAGPRSVGEPERLPGTNVEKFEATVDTSSDLRTKSDGIAAGGFGRQAQPPQTQPPSQQGKR